MRVIDIVNFTNFFHDDENRIIFYDKNRRELFWYHVETNIFESFDFDIQEFISFDINVRKLLYSDIIYFGSDYNSSNVYECVLKDFVL